ncbi:MAG: sulfotransferase domain-containing protein [Planctomycetota bacterium]
MKIKNLVSRFIRTKRIATVSSESSVGTKRSELMWRQEGFLPIDESLADDIFLVGYPKSGNTWMQNLLAGLLFRVNTQYLPDRLTQVLIPNVHGFGYYKRIGTPTIFKSHFLPRPEYRRVVYLVRDGRDAIVSYFHMLQAEGKSVSYEEMIEREVGLFPCKWNEHVRQWHENPFGAEMMFIRYEDLLSNPVEQLMRFCEFSGLDRTVNEISDCVKGNSFESMQAKEREFGWNNSNWNPEKAFIRRGRSGDYKLEMPIRAVRAFNAQSSKELELFEYSIGSESLGHD